jgi:hypothetical protein
MLDVLILDAPEEVGEDPLRRPEVILKEDSVHHLDVDLVALVAPAFLDGFEHLGHR